MWDYAPFGGEMCGGSLVNFSDNAKTFVEPGPDRIGRKYVKALYVEYTDATFTQKKVGGRRLVCCGLGSSLRAQPDHGLSGHQRDCCSECDCWLGLTPASAAAMHRPWLR